MSIVYVAGTGVRDNCKLMRVLDGRGPALRSPHHRKAPLPPVNTKVNTELIAAAGAATQQLSTLVRSLPQRDPGRSLPDTAGRGL